MCSSFSGDCHYEQAWRLGKAGKGSYLERKDQKQGGSFGRVLWMELRSSRSEGYLIGNLNLALEAQKVPISHRYAISSLGSTKLCLQSEVDFKCCQVPSSGT